MTASARNRASLFRKVSLLGVASATAGALGLFPAGSAVSAVPTAVTSATTGMTDFDVRDTVLPTSEQQSALQGLGALQSFAWNKLGTPASILPADGSLGSFSGSAVDGARQWLVDHAALFGLSASDMSGLKLVNDQLLAQGGGHAVLFEQTFGGLEPGYGSLVTVGTANGKVAYVSSSLSTTTGTPPASTLSAVQAWAKAAGNVGVTVPSDLGTIKTAERAGWTALSVPGIADPQQARLRAFPVPGQGVRPVFEVNVLDMSTGTPTAVTALVDAVSGAILRQDVNVDNETGSTPYDGPFGTDRCGHQTFTLMDGNTRQVSIVATTDQAVSKLTVTLHASDGSVLATAAGSGPQWSSSIAVLTYSNTTIPQGTYTFDVCGDSWFAGGWHATVATSDTAADPSTLTNPRWRLFESTPDRGSVAQGVKPTNSVVGCWLAASACTAQLPFQNVANTGPWDSLADGTPTLTTVGNNANTHEAWLSPLTPGGTAQAPVSVTRDYTGEFTDAWNESKCDPTSLHAGGNDINSVVTNLFVDHNRMHDWAYYLGFTEANYNLQADNLGRGGAQGDPEVGDAQAAALEGNMPSVGVVGSRDNSNQVTEQDGIPGITNQYLWQPLAGGWYGPCADGSTDMSIIGHEYTHAISNRMIGGPNDGLGGAQGASMGESWSDLDAQEYLSAHGASDADVQGVAAYTTGNSTIGIRNYSMSNNPLNFSDLGYDVQGDEVHANGEIWNGAQWQLRRAFTDKYDATYPSGDKALELACAQATGASGPRSVETCPGDRRWIQLVFDSFLLQQGTTGMIEARDAMLAADQMRFGGADADLMWKVFAQRGMGKDAEHGPDNTNPRPSFATPTGSNTVVTFNAPGNGKVYVGDYQGRAVPVADLDSTTALAPSAPFTPGTYDLTYVSPTTGMVRSTMTVSGAATQSVAFTAPLDLAAPANGASVIGSADGSVTPEALIDGDEGTSWVDNSTGTPNLTHPSVSVDLAGTGVQTVGSVLVSALPHPGSCNVYAVIVCEDKAAGTPTPDEAAGSRFAALRQFALEACVLDCSSPAAVWTRFYTSPADAFPGGTPRPVAPQLNARTFDVPDTQAAAVRLVVLNSQCTGNPAYNGVLDSDPTQDEDCTSGYWLNKSVAASEFEVFAPAATKKK